MSLEPNLKGIARLAAERKRPQDIQDALDPRLPRALRKQHEALGYDPHLAAMHGEMSRVEDALAVDSQVAATLEQPRQVDQAFAGIAVPSRYRSPEREALDRLAAAGLPERSNSPPPAPRGGPPAPAALRATEAKVRTVADIGRRVRDARKAMKMTQQRFADLAGVGRRFLIELERGKSTLEIGRVLAVCHAAGLRLTIAGTHDAHS